MRTLLNTKLYSHSKFKYLNIDGIVRVYLNHIISNFNPLEMYRQKPVWPVDLVLFFIHVHKLSGLIGQRNIFESYLPNTRQGM